MVTGNDPPDDQGDQFVENELQVVEELEGDGDDAVIGRAFRNSLLVLGGLMLIAGVVYLVWRFVRGTRAAGALRVRGGAAEAHSRRPAGAH